MAQTRTRQDYDYDADSAWDEIRSELSLSPSEYETQQDLYDAIDDHLRSLGTGGQGNWGKLMNGTRGRDMIKELAFDEWSRRSLPPPTGIEGPFEVGEGPPEIGEPERLAPSTAKEELAIVPTTRGADIEEDVRRRARLVGAEERVKTEPVPTVGIPEVKAPFEEEKQASSPGQRVNQVIDQITSSIDQNSSVQRVRGIAVSTGRRMRDTIEDVVSGLRRRLGL